MTDTDKKSTHKLTDDELQGRLQSLTDEVERIKGDYARDMDALERESDKNLSELEGADLDTELAPVEEETIAGLEDQVAELLHAADEEEKVAVQMEAEDAEEPVA